MPSAPADIVTRLKAALDRGSPSDRRVARAVLEDPEFATEAAIARLAARAAVSEPTVTRFCRTLGCSGLREFKLRLAQSLATSGRFLLAAPAGRAGADDVPSGIAAQACGAIERVCGAVDPGDLARAAALIAQGRLVRAYGSGGSSSLAAVELENRLFRLGVPASSHIDGELQKMTAAAADAGTVVVAYSVSGHVRSVVDAVEIAGSYGAATVAVTAPGSPLAASADIVLPFHVEEPADVFRPSPARYALLALTDMLATVVAQSLGTGAVERMRRIKHHQGLAHRHAHRLPLGGLMRIADLDTPAVLVDLDRVEANLARAQAYADRHGLRLRPHIKTHKLPSLARRQVELGAVGITCQKIGEAEVMAEAGLADIFLPYNILGAAKLGRLRELADRVALAVTADSLVTVDGLSAAFAGRSRPLSVLVECDTGMGRCGVASPEAALDLARAVDRAPGLRFGGLMTYPAAGQVEANAAWLADAVRHLTGAGLPPGTVSNGGTPDLWRAHEVPAATEHRPGTYVYLDRFQVARSVGSLDDCALTVLTTVVSRPTGDRAVVDAGSKALTSDTLGLDGFGLVTDYPEAVVRGLSEEHGTVDLSLCAARPRIGERVCIVPNHACPVSNLFDTVTLVSGDRVVETVPVAARGKVG